MNTQTFLSLLSITSLRWPGLAIVLFLAPSVYWIARDHSVWAWDQAWYGEISMDLWFTLTHAPGHWWPAMLTAFGAKAPGIAWLGQWFVPLGGLLGSIESGLLLSIIVAQFGTLAFMYGLGKEFIPDQDLAPLLGSMMLGSAPLFIAMSHQYFTEPLQLLAVTYVYWIAIKSLYWTRPHLIGHLLCAVSLALASKASSPLYCFMPACIAVYDGIRRRQETPVRDGPLWKSILLLLIGTVMLGTVISWYVRNGSTLVAFVKLVSSGDVALYYGSSGNFSYKVQYWLHALQRSVALPIVLFGLVIVFLIAIRRRFLTSEGWRFPSSQRVTLLAVCAFGHVVLVLTTFSFNINEENRYLLPLLPSLGVIFLWGLTFVRIRLALVLISVLFMAQWAYIESRALGLVPPDDSMSHWVLPIQSNEAMKELTRIVELTCTPETAHRLSVTGVELPWLNSHTMAFYAAKRKQEIKVPCHNTSLGFAEKDPMKAWTRLNQLNIAYFISLEETALPPSTNWLNQVSLSILQRIRADRRFAQLPYDSKFSVVVFQRSEDTK